MMPPPPAPSCCPARARATARRSRVGGFGACEVFSFHATKFFNSMEGGGVATNDDALAAALRLGINFGIKTYDQCVSLGTNGKMPEVCAAMGLTNLARVRAVVETNRRHHEAYASALNALPGLRVYDFHAAAVVQAAARGAPPPLLDVNYQYVVVQVDAAAAGLSRDQLVGLLVGENFSARRYFAPGCHGAAPYAAAPDAAAVAGRLPVTAHLCDSVMCLPTGTSVTADDVAAAAALLRFALANAAVPAAAGAWAAARPSVGNGAAAEAVDTPSTHTRAPRSVISDSLARDVLGAPAYFSL
jgi:dTDP-4-amino-4,6-dideoxygalactose transaminase